MKKLILALAIPAVAGLCSFSQSDEHVKGNGKITKADRTVGSFDKISLGGSMNLEIDQNGKEAVTVEADENVLEYIITEVENGTLKIHLKKDVHVNAAKMIIHVSCNKLNAIKSGGSGNVITVSKLTSENLSVSHGGSGNFKLDLDVKKLDIDKAGSGNFELAGKAGDVNISSAGSGDVNAKKLDCTTATISSVGSGNVELKKGTSAKVSSVGSGKVSYE